MDSIGGDPFFSKFQNEQFHHHHHRRSGISSQVGVMMPHVPVATVYAWTSDHLSNSAVPLCDAGRAGSSNSTTSSTPQSVCPMRDELRHRTAESSNDGGESSCVKSRKGVTADLVGACCAIARCARTFAVRSVLMKSQDVCVVPLFGSSLILHPASCGVSCTTSHGRHWRWMMMKTDAVGPRLLLLIPCN